MKNLKIIKKNEGDNYFLRNNKFYLKKNQKKYFDEVNFILKKKNIGSLLEIGCATGIHIHNLKKKFKLKKCYGLDLSKKAIEYGKKNYKNIELFNCSSLELESIKITFDVIICGFFLYLLDREEIFNQFNLISNKLNNNGFLIIEDFDPLFKHSNLNIHNKEITCYKANYINFLEESGIYKLIYKKGSVNNNSLKFFSSDQSICILQKKKFINFYPHKI
jgi:ubiquinone/menaquinone biosynthesis C-methylase UbiE